MQDKVAHMRRLMAEGYTVVGVDSNDDFVEATLRRADRTVVLRLHRSDAERLLLGGARLAR